MERGLPDLALRMLPVNSCCCGGPAPLVIEVRAVAVCGRRRLGGPSAKLKSCAMPACMHTPLG